MRNDCLDDDGESVETGEESEESECQQSKVETLETRWLPNTKNVDDIELRKGENRR